MQILRWTISCWWHITDSEAEQVERAVDVQPVGSDLPGGGRPPAIEPGAMDALKILQPDAIGAEDQSRVLARNQRRIDRQPAAGRAANDDVLKIIACAGCGRRLRLSLGLIGLVCVGNANLDQDIAKREPIAILDQVSLGQPSNKIM